MFLKLELLVKIASSLLILLYLFANLTLILFRESKISSYHPKFRAPFYPYLQIFGILGGVFLLIEMGTFIVFLTTIFLLLGIIWYKIYAQKRASQDSALIYVLERLVARDKELTSDNLLTELKDVVLQRDDFIKDKFSSLVEESGILDIDEPLELKDFFEKVCGIFGEELNVSPQELAKKFLEREGKASTVVRKGLAVPHIVIEGKNILKVLLVRAKTGIIFPGDKIVHIIFVLVGSYDKRYLLIRKLAAIARITQNPEFDKKCLYAADKKELKDIVSFLEKHK